MASQALEDRRQPDRPVRIEYGRFTKTTRAVTGQPVVSQIQDVTLVDVQLKLAERYSMLSHVVSNNQGPVSYAYYGYKDPPPGIHEQFSVFDTRFPVRRTFNNIDSKWQSLKDKEKRDLLLILYCGTWLFNKLRYCIQTDTWEKRIQLPALGDTFTGLHRYGKEIEDGSDVLTYLAGGNVEEYLETVSNKAAFDLYGLWLTALTYDMTNGCAHMAVWSLLNRLKHVLDGFEEEMPSVWVANVTSSTAVHANCRTSCSTSSSSRWETVERKDVTQKSNKGQLQDDDDAAHGGEEKKEENEGAKNDAESHRHNVDLTVSCLDNMSGRAYYLFVVDVLSHPKTMDEAEMKFKEEMIHVLQSQLLVYGLLFGPQEVRLYTAERRAESDHAITIEYSKYYLVERSSSLHGNFDVGSFELLVMDILSSLLEGMNEICDKRF